LGEKEDRQEPEICIVCAWRLDCQKKFSLTHGQRCLEFSRDMALKAKPVGQAPQKEEK